MIKFWRHLAYRSPTVKSFLICGTAHAVEKVEGTTVSLFTENDIIAVRAEVQNGGGRRWTRSFWVVRMNSKGSKMVLSVDQRVDILFSVAGSQKNIKRAVRIIKSVLKRPGIRIDDIDYSLLSDALEISLPDTDIVKIIAKAA